MNKQERILPTKTLIKYLYYYMKGYYKQYLLAIFFMVINVGCDLALPYLIGVSLKLLGKEVILLESLICVAVLGLMIIAVLCISSYCLTMTLHYTSHKIIYKMREDVFAHIQNLSHAQLSMIPTGTLVTRATSDVNVLWMFRILWK